MLLFTDQGAEAHKDQKKNKETAGKQDTQSCRAHRENKDGKDNGQYEFQKEPDPCKKESQYKEEKLQYKDSGKHHQQGQNSQFNHNITSFICSIHSL